MLPEFDIRYDLHGDGEPQVVLFRAGTLTERERVPLSEAERRGLVSEEQAAHARVVNEQIRQAMTGVSRVRGTTLGDKRG